MGFDKCPKCQEMDDLATHICRSEYQVRSLDWAAVWELTLAESWEQAAEKYIAGRPGTSDGSNVMVQVLKVGTPGSRKYQVLARSRLYYSTTQIMDK